MQRSGSRHALVDTIPLIVTPDHMTTIRLLKVTFAPATGRRAVPFCHPGEGGARSRPRSPKPRPGSRCRARRESIRESISEKSSPIHGLILKLDARRGFWESALDALTRKRT